MLLVYARVKLSPNDSFSKIRSACQMNHSSIAVDISYVVWCVDVDVAGAVHAIEKGCIIETFDWFDVAHSV